MESESLTGGSFSLWLLVPVSESISFSDANADEVSLLQGRDKTSGPVKRNKTTKEDFNGNTHIDILNTLHFVAIDVFKLSEYLHHKNEK